MDVSAEGPQRFPGGPEVEEDEGAVADSEREESEPEGEQDQAGMVRPREDQGTRREEPPLRRPRVNSIPGSPEPMREPSLHGTPARGPSQLGPPAGAVHTNREENLYVEVDVPRCNAYRAQDAEAYFIAAAKSFDPRKKRPDEEINIKQLTPTARKLFL